MITLFEELLRTVLADTVASPDHVRFVAPDAAWRTFVAAGNQEYLSVHLVDLRENRKLRSSDTRVPARLDCHYVISAWLRPEPLVDGALALSPMQRESQLLYVCARTIMNSAPFVPADILGAGAAPWLPFENHALPIVVAPPEGFAKIPEYWGTLGPGQRYKPILYVIATLPIARPPESEGPPVTTMLSDYEIEAERSGETLVLIGGTVRVGGRPAAGAAVAVFRGASQVAQGSSDAAGRFRLRLPEAGTYRIEVKAQGNVAQRDVAVPSLTGDYDIDL